MRRLCSQLIVSLSLVLFAGSALAFSLSTDFTGVTINQANLTTTTGQNQWNDLVRWQIMATGGNPDAWAQQTPHPDLGPGTSLLFYGFDASGLGAESTLSLQFDYINSTLNSFNGTVYLGGLSGSEQIFRFATWGDLNSTFFINQTLGNKTNDWNSFLYNGILLKLILINASVKNY
jgi:hypothetical protein